MCCRKCVFGKHGVAATGDSTCGVGLGLGAAFRFRVLAVALVVRFLGAAFPLVAFTLGVACLAAVLVFLAALVAGFAFGAALRLAVAFCFTAARFFAMAGFLGLDAGRLVRVVVDLALARLAAPAVADRDSRADLRGAGVSAGVVLARARLLRRSVAPPRSDSVGRSLLAEAEALPSALAELVARAAGVWPPLIAASWCGVVVTRGGAEDDVSRFSGCGLRAPASLSPGPLPSPLRRG